MIQQDIFPAETYKARRDTLRKSMGSGQILLIGNDESSVNFTDNWYPYRQDSTFLYYFGISQAGLMGIIDCDEGIDYLVGDDLSIDDIVWTGKQPSIKALAESVGVINSCSWAQVDSLISEGVHYLPPYRPEGTIKLMDLLFKSKAFIDSNYSMKLIHSIVGQRNIKSSEEIAELHKAVDITSKMHLAVMQAAKPGLTEYELVGLAAQIIRSHNVNPSFQPIMTINGQVLHNHFYGNTIAEGDLLLFDGGAESPKGYAGDMTRTYPVSKTFSTLQGEMYDVVYDAHRAAVDAVAPGVRFLDVHLIACKTLVSGLTEIGLMKGDPEEAVQVGAHTMFFQCGLGHMMGLDVHDMENFGEQNVGYTNEHRKSTKFGLKSLRLGKELEIGNVLTVEPGIYIIPELIDMWKAEDRHKDFINYEMLEKHRDFGGIRVEEDFVVGSQGAELLGIPLAIERKEVEAVRQSVL